MVVTRWLRSRRSARRGGEPVYARTLQRFDIGLYPDEAPSGSFPIVLVPVGATEPIRRLAHGQQVVCRGELQAGGAVMIEADGHRFDPIGPCVVPVIKRRRYRL
jgi:hypothetical protein